MIDKVKEQIEICKCYWKTIFVGSFVVHFVIDSLIIFPLGVLLGMHIGH